MAFSTSFIVISEPSITTASSATFKAPISFSMSFLSRFFMFSKTSSYDIVMPFSSFCLTLLLALTSTFASRYIFTSALGNITVPMSLPSIITSLPWAIFLWSPAIATLICFIDDTKDTFSDTSLLLILSVTSWPFKNTFCFPFSVLNSIWMFFNISEIFSSSSIPIFLFIISSVTHL